MIDLVEFLQRVVTIDAAGILPSFELAGSFRAPEDLTLRQAIFQGTGSQLLSFDPDLTPLTAGQVMTDFLLIAHDPRSLGLLNHFENLAIPVLKGQVIYWGVAGGVSDQVVQLIFS